MTWFGGQIDNSPQMWPYGLRCSDCGRLLVGGTTRDPVYKRLDVWASLKVLAWVWEPVCGDCL